MKVCSAFTVFSLSSAFSQLIPSFMKKVPVIFSISIVFSILFFLLLEGYYVILYEVLYYFLSVKKFFFDISISLMDLYVVYFVNWYYYTKRIFMDVIVPCQTD